MVEPKIWIEELEFNDGSKIKFSENDIIIFVGPNNAGKSASLKEIANRVRNNSNQNKIIVNSTFNKRGSFEDLMSFISKHSLSHDGNNLSGYQYNIYKPSASTYWNRGNEFHDLANFFVSHLNTESRLQASNPPRNISLTSQAPEHPIHFLQKNDALEYQFSNFFKQAFGTDLIVHRNAGGEVPLYVGIRPSLEEGEDRLSIGYQSKLEKLDLLHHQGDGMRSFVGVLLHAFISHYSILFIDEPEAFLHPPQARLLGKMLAKNLPSERQVFLSTHSEDFLKGLLDSNAKNLKVIRIQRNTTINNISLLDNKDIEQIWNDSLLRHSNVLNGLFHSKVVICESDSDSRFYSAILSALYDDSSEIAPDVLFINVGGKHRLPVAIKALKKLNVSIKVIADFDVLNNSNPIKNIFVELGGNWDEIEKKWQLVKSSIDSRKPEYQTSDAKEEIEKIFSSISDKIMPRDKIKAIETTLKKSSPWTEAKEVGKSYIRSGDETKAYDEIQTKFKEVGFLIPDSGEVESFCKSIGGHGPKWVNEVLSQKDLKNDPELEDARKFVEQFLS
ncbi:MAG: ATP-dependent nuclease [Flavobacterium sp.]